MVIQCRSSIQRSSARGQSAVEGGECWVDHVTSFFCCWKSVRVFFLFLAIQHISVSKCLATEHLLTSKKGGDISPRNKKPWATASALCTATAECSIGWLYLCFFPNQWEKGKREKQKKLGLSWTRHSVLSLNGQVCNLYYYSHELNRPETFSCWLPKQEGNLAVDTITCSFLRSCRSLIPSLSPHPPIQVKAFNNVVLF